MRKLLTLVLLALCLPVQAESFLRPYATAATLNFKLYNADGTLDVDEADGGTEVSVSCNEGAETTATNDFVDEGTFYSIALTSGEMTCARIAVIVAATTTEVFFIDTYGNASATIPSIAATLAAGSIASGAIDATAIAADAIGASEIATDAIGAAEIAADAIGSSEIATGAIAAAEIAADAIGASEVAADVSTELLTGLANLAVNVAQISTDSTAADTLETWLDGTAGSAAPLGIVDQGTAQAATGTTLQLRSAAALADDTAIGMTAMACGSTQGYCQSRTVTDYVSSTDTATVDTWTVTPSGTITYYLFATSPGGGGSVSIAAGGITSSSFAAGAIDASAIAADAIGASEIATDAIGAAEIAASAIGASEIADGGITSTEFGTGAITATVIAADAIGASELADNAIDAGAIATDAITAAKIAADAIGASELATDAIGAAEVAADAIGASEIAADAIGASEIANNAIDAASTAADFSTEVQDADVESVNGVTINGDGSGTPFGP